MEQEDDLKYFREELHKAHNELENLYGIPLTEDELYLALAEHYDIMGMPPEIIFKKSRPGG